MYIFTLLSCRLVPYSFQPSRFPGAIFFSFQDIRYPFTGMAISIWIARLAHCFICLRIIQQLGECLIDYFFISTDKSQRSGINAFRAFSRVSHNKYWHAIARALLLDPSGIVQSKIRSCFKLFTVKYFYEEATLFIKSSLIKLIPACFISRHSPARDPYESAS